MSAPIMFGFKELHQIKACPAYGCSRMWFQCLLLSVSAYGSTLPIYGYHVCCHCCCCHQNLDLENFREFECFTPATSPTSSLQSNRNLLCNWNTRYQIIPCWEVMRSTWERHTFGTMRSQTHWYGKDNNLCSLVRTTAKNQNKFDVLTRLDSSGPWLWRCEVVGFEAWVFFGLSGLYPIFPVQRLGPNKVGDVFIRQTCFATIKLICRCRTRMNQYV